MNKVILIGRLTKDPEMRSTGAGLAVTTFTLAVNRPFSDSNGERTADFINCVAWRRQAENIAKYCVKGTQVAAEGRIQTRTYDHTDGTKRYVTEVICDNVTFLSTKSDMNRSNSSYSMPEKNSYPSNDIETTDISEDPFKDFGEEIALSEDDLPF